jgi:hypothetical protein
MTKVLFWEKDYIPLKNSKHVGSLIHGFTHQAFIIQKLSKSFVSWKQKNSIKNKCSPKLLSFINHNP